ncbi:hypothetical protein ACFE04_019817 [Oxalis oulophora]
MCKNRNFFSKRLRSCSIVKALKTLYGGGLTLFAVRPLKGNYDAMENFMAYSTTTQRSFAFSFDGHNRGYECFNDDVDPAFQNTLESFRFQTRGLRRRDDAKKN